MTTNRHLCTLLVVVLALSHTGSASRFGLGSNRGRRGNQLLPTTSTSSSSWSSRPKNGVTPSYSSRFHSQNPTTARGGGSTTSTAGGGLTFAQRMWMGGVSRAIAQMTLYPIDAMRTLAQTREGKTLAHVGVSALIRGSTTTSMFALFMGSIQFAVFGACRDKLGPLVASALGAASSCIVSVPQEVIKQRLVAGIYPSFRQAVVSIFKDEGIRGFYSAWKPTMARNVPFVMTTFTSMDLLKSLYLKKRSGRVTLGADDESEIPTIQTVAIGMTAALVAGCITQPMDVIKTRMMTQAASNQVPYSSAWDCFLTILRTEGAATFYAGFKQRSTYMCLLWGMTFALNAQFQKQLERRH